MIFLIEHFVRGQASAAVNLSIYSVFCVIRALIRRRICVYKKYTVNQLALPESHYLFPTDDETGCLGFERQALATASRLTFEILDVVL